MSSSNNQQRVHEGSYLLTNSGNSVAIPSNGGAAILGPNELSAGSGSFGVNPSINTQYNSFGNLQDSYNSNSPLLDGNSQQPSTKKNPLSVAGGYEQEDEEQTDTYSIFTSVPLHSPATTSHGISHDASGGPSSGAAPTYVHAPHASQIPDKYLSILGASHNQVIKKKKAAIALKVGRKWLTNIIIVQTVGNLIRALPVFILEKYYVMLLIFFQAVFLLVGSYGVKRLKKYLILLYAVGCFGTTILDLVITFTYAHSTSLDTKLLTEKVIAFWCYVLFVSLLCTLNIIGGIVLGLKLFVSLHTLSDRGVSPLVLLAASLVGGFDSEEEEEKASVRTNRCIIFYGSDLKKALNNTISFSRNITILNSMRQKISSLGDRLRSISNKPSSSVPTDAQSNLERFVSNEVITSKYNIITFFPKVIFYQFSRLANLYTLCIVGLCMFSFSPVGPISSVTPLLVVISVSCFKEFVEDIKRHKQDKEINNRTTMIYRPPVRENGESAGSFEKANWKDLKVGDIIYVQNDELLPADIICLSTSRPDGRTYLETANLDGETNLKLKTHISKCGWIRNSEDLDRFSCKVDYEGPNNDIYGFEGVLTILKGMENVNDIHASSITGKTNYVPVTIESSLWRGTKLRNTEWVIGVVVYTGTDTKVEKNSMKSSQKRSSVERGVNNKLIMLFLLQTIICIICSIGHNRWHLEDDKEAKPWYIGANASENDFIYVSYVILYNTLIPLSMYVSMEVIRVSNAHFIDSDIEMYDEKSDTPACARNTNINEELGQIQYLFSDKTGTLTCNEMVFNRCTIGGKIYGPENIGARLQADMTSGGSEEAIPTYIREFLTCLAICNTVVIEKSKEGADLNYDPKSHPRYQAASPDEEALTIAAANYGFVLKSREDKIVTISVHGREERYEVLNVLEFNSYRKRMSVIVRTESGQIRLYCKGADSVILERSERISPIPDVDIIRMTEGHLSQFATNGLRTLCMSMAILDPETYITWNRRFEEASVSLTKRTEEMDAAAEAIERQMCLLGATGIEDRLQDNVPETITSLREAGIKVWVLTGDKQETAISIATASAVISSGMEVVILNETNKDDLMKRLLELVGQKRLYSFNDARKWGPNFVVKMAEKLKLEPSDAPLILSRTSEMQMQLAIVIDGTTLQLALDKDLRYHFLQVAKTCESVVCCRCSPSQKAKVVKLVSERSFLFGDGAITMAIGDGANDVPMIQKAHVGVGISGREGMQAVLASDFAIANFQMLRRLLLVHGNRSYKRMTKLILYSFSKNVALSISQFWFGFYSAFSGQMIYFDFLFTLYNALFTSLPVLSLGTFDQDVREETLLARPTLYRECQSNKPFSTKQFAWWIFIGMWQSAVIFYVTFEVLQSSTVDGGKTLGLWSCGTAAYLYLVMTVNLQIASITRYWTKSNIISVIGSVIASVLFVIIYSLVYWIEPEAQDIIFELFTVPNFWMLYIMVPTIGMLPFVFVSLNKWMFSTDSIEVGHGFLKLDEI
eukprot:gene16143-19208_t